MLDKTLAQLCNAFVVLMKALMYAICGLLLCMAAATLVAAVACLPSDPLLGLIQGFASAALTLLTYIMAARSDLLPDKLMGLMKQMDGIIDDAVDRDFVRHGADPETVRRWREQDNLKEKTFEVDGPKWPISF